MTSFSDAMRALKEGQPGAADVLRDLMFEAGVPDHAISDLFYGLLLGPSEEVTMPTAPMRRELSNAHPFRTVRPYRLYDTCEAHETHGRVPFFRDLIYTPLGKHIKTETDTNCFTPRRLDGGTALKLRRLSAVALSGTPDGVLQFMVNNALQLQLPVEDIIEAGHFGVPLLGELSDRDDIRVTWYGMKQVPARLRVSLHGWLFEPVA